jgi:hypothetical protein
MATRESGVADHEGDASVNVYCNLNRIGITVNTVRPPMQPLERP